jgi:NitT/TauT family transport system substrate-binding protein
MKPVLRTVCALALLLAATCACAQAGTPTRLKMVLDWKYQGLHAWFIVAQDKGYFAQEGLDVTVDSGDGSASAVTKVASGAYDAAFGDMSTIIQVAANSPQTAPIGVFMLYNRAPFVIVSKKARGIVAPKDLEGKILGSPVNGAAYKLFPAFAKAAGIDASKVTVTNMAANLQETMLARGDVDALAAFVNTVWFSVKPLKIDPQKDLNFIYYADHGMDLYSNGVLVSRKLANSNPAAVRGLVRAINRAIADVLTNPDAGVEAVARRDPLIDKALEKQRLLMTYKLLIATPEARELGLGDVDDARLARSIKTVAEVYGLPRQPAPQEVFSHAFLPPKSERPVR